MSSTVSQHMATDAVVNIRSDQGDPLLVLDGVPFPYSFDKTRGVKVEARDDNVHLVTISIQVDRSVTILDKSLPEGEAVVAEHKMD